eukprot:jgi/Chrzof1/1682/Cz10g17040.t1
MIDTDIMVKLDGPCIMMTLTMLGTTADITAHIEQIDWQHLMLTDPQHLIGMMTADTAGMTVTRMLVTTATETAATAQLSANTGVTAGRLLSTIADNMQTRPGMCEQTSQCPVDQHCHMAHQYQRIPQQWDPFNRALCAL